MDSFKPDMSKLQLSFNQILTYTCDVSHSTIKWGDPQKVWVVYVGHSERSGQGDSIETIAVMKKIKEDLFLSRYRSCTYIYLPASSDKWNSRDRHLLKRICRELRKHDISNKRR